MNLKEDLTDSSSLLFNSLEMLDKQAEDWIKKAVRVKELNRLLVYRIQNDYITDIEVVTAALAWFNHYPELSPQECIEYAIGEKENEN